MPAPNTIPTQSPTTYWAETADLIQGLTAALKSIQRPHRVEHFSGSKSENAEQWLRKFEIAAKANGWIHDPIMMSDQFLCHLESPASDWFQEQETIITGGTWENAKVLFLERFCRSVLQSATDLRRIRQKADETVQQFSERISVLWAKFPTQPEEIKVGDFVGKLLPRYRMIMAYQFPKTTREAINLAKMAEEPLENEEHERQDLEERVKSRAPEKVIHEWSDKQLRPSNRPPPPPKNRQRHDRQEFNQDYRSDSRPSAFQPPRPQQSVPRPENNFRNNSAVPMEVDMAQQRGPQCFKCGGYGHVARECRSQPQAQSNMIEKAAAVPPKIGTQRPANGVGFNVGAQSVQRPSAPRKIITPVRPDNEALLNEVSITMPFTGFTKLPGMNKRVTNFLTGMRPAAALAQETVVQQESDIEDHRNGFATMRIEPGSVSINGQPSSDTVLDSGASFSMASRYYVQACGMERSLVETQLIFTTADGNTAGANYMLPKAKIQVGLCTYEMKLVVADNPRFDLLLGVDFLAASNANIRMDLRKVLLTGIMDAQEITEPLKFTVGQDMHEGVITNEMYTGEVKQNAANTHGQNAQHNDEETEAGVAAPDAHPPSTIEISTKQQTTSAIALPEVGVTPVLPRIATGFTRQISEDDNRAPVQPVATTEAGVDPLTPRSERLKQIWDKQWEMLDESAAATKAHLDRTINDPDAHPARVAAAKRALAFEPVRILRSQDKMAQQTANSADAVKGLTGSEGG